MKSIYLGVLITLVISCSHDSPKRVKRKEVGPKRSIASVPIKQLQEASIDLKYKQPVIASAEHWYEALVHLKDDKAEPLNAMDGELSIKASNDVKVSDLNLIQDGLYSFVFLPSMKYQEVKLELFVGNEKIATKKFKIVKDYDLDKSEVTYLYNTSSVERHYELTLKDDSGKIFDTHEAPDVYLEGDGEIKEVKKIGNGKWLIVLQMLEANSVTYLGLKREHLYSRRKVRINHVHAKLDILSSGFKDKKAISDIKNYARVNIKLIEESGRKIVDYKPWRILAKFDNKELDASAFKYDKKGAFFEVRCQKIGSYPLEVYLGEERLDSINVECTPVH